MATPRAPPKGKTRDMLAALPTHIGQLRTGQTRLRQAMTMRLRRTRREHALYGSDPLVAAVRPLWTNARLSVAPQD